MVRREHRYAIGVCDRRATVSQRFCGVSRIVKRNSRTQVFFKRGPMIQHDRHAASARREAPM